MGSIHQTTRGSVNVFPFFPRLAQSRHQPVLPTILQIKSSSVVIVAPQCVMCQCALSAMCGAFSRSVPWHSVNHAKPFYATLHYNVAIRVNSESHKWHLAHLLTKQDKFTYIFFRVDHRGYHPHMRRQRWMIRSFLTLFLPKSSACFISMFLDAR